MDPDLSTGSEEYDAREEWLPSIVDWMENRKQRRFYDRGIHL